MSSKASICLCVYGMITPIDGQQNYKSNLRALSDPKTPVHSRNLGILPKISISLAKSIFWARSFSMFRLLSILNLSSFMLLRTKVRTLSIHENERSAATLATGTVRANRRTWRKSGKPSVGGISITITSLILTGLGFLLAISSLYIR
jgi:hypothetical protein